MRGSAAAVLAWAVLLAALAGVLCIWNDDELQIALLGGAAILTMFLGLALAVVSRQADEPRRIPDLSLASLVVGIALAAMLVGAEAGPWLVYVGGGMLLLGLAGLFREVRGAREGRRLAGKARPSGAQMGDER
jgi:peptidoglycan/LPS O-acetylase OafA/YrhL